jgi:hypothetical protein
VVGALVDADGPPPLRERRGGDEPRDAASCDLRVALRGDRSASRGYFFFAARSITVEVASSDVGSHSVTALLTP